MRSFTLASGSANIWVGRAFFIWTSVFNLFVVSVFWGFMVDVFNNDQGKRLFGFIAAAATLGGLVGSSLTASLVSVLGVGIPWVLNSRERSFIEACQANLSQVSTALNVWKDHKGGGRNFPDVARVTAPRPAAGLVVPLLVADGVLPRDAAIHCPGGHGPEPCRLTLEQIRGIARRVPQAQLLELPQCGHSPHKDQAEKVIEAVKAFTAQSMSSRP